MRKVVSIIGAIALMVALAGCSSGGADTDPSASTSVLPTPDASLIPPTAGTEVKAVDFSQFDVGFDEYMFKVGEGPVWCTINVAENWSLCEISEPAAEYAAIPVPDNCEGSYGYQIKLFGAVQTEGQTAGFICSGGYYSDPSVAQTLNNSESVSVGDITCYVKDLAARCDNKSGQYIALGPQVWAAKN